MPIGKTDRALKDGALLRGLDGRTRLDLLPSRRGRAFGKPHPLSKRTIVMMSQTVGVPYLPFLQRLRASFAKLTLAGLLATGAAAPAWADQPAPANEQVLRLVTANMPRSLDPVRRQMI